VKQGALNLSQQIRDFSFLVMLIIWYDVHHRKQNYLTELGGRPTRSENSWKT
jgi:hypothetical protein